MMAVSYFSCHVDLSLYTYHRSALLYTLLRLHSLQQKCTVSMDNFQTFYFSKYYSIQMPLFSNFMSKRTHVPRHPCSILSSLLLYFLHISIGFMFSIRDNLYVHTFQQQGEYFETLLRLYVCKSAILHFCNSAFLQSKCHEAQLSLFCKVCRFQVCLSQPEH